MKFSKLVKVTCLSMSGLFVSCLQADTQVSLLTGIDDNPFRLTNSLNAKQGFFLNAAVDYDNRFKNGLSINFSARAIEFEARVEDASSVRWDAGGGYRYQFNKSSRIDFEGSVGQLDKTYISRSTGRIGSFSGTSIPDRYDFVWQKAAAKYQNRLNKRNRIQLGVEYYNKDYFDYINLTLAKFDYQRIAVDANWRYRWNKDWTTYLDFRAKQRVYEDRRARTLQGDLIDGSDLEYQYNRVSINTRWNIDEEMRLSLRLFSEDRQDNHSGYYDTNFSGYSLSWRRKTEEDAIITARLRYQDYKNENNVTEDEFEEEQDTNDNRGFVLSFSFRKPFWNVGDVGIDGYFRTSLYHFKAEQRIYEYNRQLFEVGLRARF